MTKIIFGFWYFLYQNNTWVFIDEFLNGFITILHEEISREVSITPSGTPRNNLDKLQIQSINTWDRFFNKKYSFIIKDFHGQAVNSTCCPECKYNTYNFDPMLIISLDIDDITDIYHFFTFSLIAISDATVQNAVFKMHNIIM